MSDLEQRLAKRKPTATFTSNKLNLMDAVDYDQRVDPYAKLVFREIIRCLNEKTGRCFPSDDFIVCMISGSRKSAYLARMKLRKYGYLDWYKIRLRGSGAVVNQYFFDPAVAAPVLATAKRKRETRKEQREMLRREAEERISLTASPMTQSTASPVTH